VASAADDRTIVWNLNPSWELTQAIGSGDMDSPLTDRVNALDFSPDGKVLATASGEPTRSGEVKLWSVSDGSLLNAFTNVHSDAVLSLRFSPDGRFLASSSADRFVRVVELAKLVW
jgi:WD40 repeat protein